MARVQTGSYRVQLEPELRSVVAARQLVLEAVDAWGLGERVRHDAALVVSELVANAVLHAGTPLRLAIIRRGPGVRIEVADRDRRLPSEGSPQTDLTANRSMTGRGLALVALMSHRWGAEPRTGGKVVWAEVGGAPTDPAGPAGVAPGGAGDEGAAATGVTVRLLGVPVRVVVESTRHLGDLQRELQVMDMSGETRERSELGEVVRAGQPWMDVVGQWAGSERRLAERAADAGREYMDVDVTVPADIAARIEGVAEWLTKAAAAPVRRALLTTPAGPEVVAYRRWYRDEIVGQLAGRPPRPFPGAVVPAG